MAETRERLDFVHPWKKSRLDRSTTLTGSIDLVEPGSLGGYYLFPGINLVNTSNLPNGKVNSMRVDFAGNSSLATPTMQNTKTSIITSKWPLDASTNFGDG